MAWMNQERITGAGKMKYLQYATTTNITNRRKLLNPDRLTNRYHLEPLVKRPLTNEVPVESVDPRPALELKHRVRRAMVFLTDRQRLIVTLRFGLNGHDVMSSAEIGQRLGLSIGVANRECIIALNKVGHQFYTLGRQDFALAQYVNR